MDRPADEMYGLSALLDNELNQREAAEVKRKIMQSEKWRCEYENLKALNNLLQHWDRIEIKDIQASASYELRLLQRLRNLKKHAAPPFTILILPPPLGLF
jgi:hypothetical protein